VVEFIRLRFFNMLTGQGYPQDVVDAVLAAGFAEPVDALQRVRALAEMKQREDFEALAVAFKRVVNIIKGGVPETVRPELLQADCEKQLAAAVARAAEEVRAAGWARRLCRSPASRCGLARAGGCFFRRGHGHGGGCGGAHQSPGAAHRGGSSV
jgi:glycyl-tRNA synthetase beta subunit